MVLISLRMSDDLTLNAETLPAAAAQAPPGRVLFGRYRILRELGRGGMGQVLLAQDEELGHPVAIKIVPDTVVKDTEAVSDIKKEVLRGIALTHPGIVRTHNFERDDSGAAIVMEYVDGSSLQELKVQQPDGCFDPEEILPWIEQFCAVLDYAHSDAKIVHRDLKPRNLMITKAGRLKVADFGISAMLTETVTRNTADGMTTGTPCYMSPQQAMGKRPSPLDDVYALGATIFELLTGKPPFFRGQILAQVISEMPVSMAARREEFGLAHRRPIPGVWEETVAACLAKEPGERPQSAGEVVQRLKGVAVDGERTSAAQTIDSAKAAAENEDTIRLDRVPGRAIPPGTPVSILADPTAAGPTQVTYVRLPPEESAAPRTNSIVLDVLVLAMLLGGGVGWWRYSHHPPNETKAVPVEEKKMTVVNSLAIAPPIVRKAATPAPTPMLAPVLRALSEPSPPVVVPPPIYILPPPPPEFMPNDPHRPPQNGGPMQRGGPVQSGLMQGNGPTQGNSSMPNGGTMQNRAPVQWDPQGRPIRPGQSQ